jgi:DNA/RNA-binding domain of Phe-tRNA-synthetase-like protein
MSPRSERRAEAAKRHVAALRAFHTGLVAETHRHLHVLTGMARHIDVLRQPNRLADEKLAAAHASCRLLTKLERLKQPWRETYRDFRRSLKRARTVYHEMVNSARRRARRT